MHYDERKIEAIRYKPKKQSMETVIKFYSKGVQVERSFFTCDEGLKKRLEQLERALKKAHEKTGKWIKEIELNVVVSS